MTAMLRSALRLAERGLAVFPCVPGGKEPACANGFKAASADAAVIEAWWRTRPDCNIAVATGVVSGIFAVDIDGIDGELGLRRLEAEHGELPATVEVITDKGRHCYFRMPEVQVRNSASKVADRVDVRGDGGYALVPPSLHPSGRRYTWSVDSATSFAAAPDWLLTRIGRPGAAVPAPPAEWRDLVRDGVGEGLRNQTVTRLAGYLLRRRVDPLVALELLSTTAGASLRSALSSLPLSSTASPAAS